MNPLSTQILQTLQELKAKGNLPLEQQARMIAQRLEQSYAITPKHRELDLQTKSPINNLNIVLIKIIRDLFAPRVREKYEELFRIGAINTPQGARELEDRWLAFHRSKGHLAVLKTIARCMVCALSTHEPTQETNELIQLLAHPQNLTDQEFLTRVYHILQTHKQSQSDQIAQYVDMMGAYMYELCALKCTKKAGAQGAQTKTQIGAQIHNLFKNLTNKELAALCEKSCEKWSAQINALQIAHTKTYENLKARDLGEREGTELAHTIEDFMETKQAVLCVMRVFNHREIAKVFGQEGYARQVLVFKRSFLQHFESLHHNRDVFEPKDGVFYLLLEGDRDEIDRCFEAFCAFLRQQVFSYKEHKQRLKFDGRLFDKSGDFLQILLELRAHIGEVL